MTTVKNEIFITWHEYNMKIFIGEEWTFGGDIKVWWWGILLGEFFMVGYEQTFG